MLRYKPNSTYHSPCGTGDSSWISYKALILRKDPKPPFKSYMTHPCGAQHGSREIYLTPEKGPTLECMYQTHLQQLQPGSARHGRQAILRSRNK